MFNCSCSYHVRIEKDGRQRESTERKNGIVVLIMANHFKIIYKILSSLEKAMKYKEFDERKLVRIEIKDGIV